jgi:hypothetical protein
VSRHGRRQELVVAIFDEFAAILAGIVLVTFVRCGRRGHQHGCNRNQRPFGHVSISRF